MLGGLAAFNKRSSKHTNKMGLVDGSEQKRQVKGQMAKNRQP